MLLLPKTLFLLAFLGLFCLPLGGQSLRISEAFELSRDLDYRLIGSYGDTILLYRRNRGGLFLERFTGPKLERLSPQRLKLEDETPQALSLINWSGHWALVYAYQQQQTTRIQLARFNSAGELLGDSLLFRLEQKFNLKPEQIFWSEDKKQLGFYVFPSESKLELGWIDLSSGARKQQRFNLEEGWGMRHFSGIWLWNKGKISLFFERAGSRRRGRAHTWLWQDWEEGQLKKQSFKQAQASNNPSEILWQLDERNEQMVGLKLQLNAQKQAERLSYLRFKGDSLLEVGHDLPPSLLNSLPKSKREKRNKGLKNLSIQQLILRRDGGLLALCEQQTKQQYQMSGHFGFAEGLGQVQTDFLFEHILAVSFNPDGAWHWQELLLKSQFSENDEARYSSFFLFKAPSNLQLFYNDEIKTQTPVYAYTLNPMGAEPRRSLPIFQGQELLIEWAKALQIDLNKLLLTSMRNGKLRIIELVLEP